FGQTAVGEGRFQREMAGKSQFGQVTIKFEPLKRGEGFKFVRGLSEEKANPKITPNNFVLAVETGLREALLGGIIVGYPAVDIQATLIDIVVIENESTEVAYKIASSLAFKDAAKKASPVILEPIMNCEVTSPDDYMGGVIGDL